MNLHDFRAGTVLEPCDVCGEPERHPVHIPAWGIETVRAEHYQALRSQLKATQRAIRTSIQLLAEAERLDELVRVAKEAGRNHDRNGDRNRVAA